MHGDTLFAASHGELRFRQGGAGPSADPSYFFDIDAAFGFRGGGLYRSLDGGTTWSSLNVTGDGQAFNVFDLSGVPDEPNTYYVAVQEEGIFRTTDNGATWLNVSQFDPTLDLAITTSTAVDFSDINNPRPEFTRARLGEQGASNIRMTVVENHDVGGHRVYVGLVEAGINTDEGDFILRDSTQLSAQLEYLGYFDSFYFDQGFIIPERLELPFGFDDDQNGTIDPNEIIVPLFDLDVDN